MAVNNKIIEVTPTGEVSFPNDVTNFLQALSSLGALSPIIGQIIAVRVQMKQLQNDAEEIKRDYEARNKIIDGAMKYAIQQLELQKIGMKKYFEYASKQLELSRIDNSERGRVMQSMTRLMSDPKASIEEKRLAQETIRAMSSDMIISQETGSTRLSALIESSNKNLLSIPSLAGLLPPAKQ